MRLRFCLLILVALMGIGLDSKANSCGCDSIPNWEAAFEKANIVILGTCIDITPNTHKGGLNILIQVDSSWKRATEFITTVHTNSSNQCGYPFVRGERFIIFANKRHQTVETSGCEPNQNFKQGGELALRRLGKGFAPGREGLAAKMDWMLAAMVGAGLLFLAIVVLRKKLKPAKKS